MCFLCGGSGSHAVSINERPAVRLAGLHWSGTYEEASAGALVEILQAVQEFSAGRSSVWTSPIIGLTRNVGENGFGYFAGIAMDDGEVAPPVFAVLDVPAMKVATSWHSGEDGSVVAHYGQMLEWLRGSGYARDRSTYDHREEYPHDADFKAEPTLRLLLPIVREGMVAQAAD